MRRLQIPVVLLVLAASGAAHAQKSHVAVVGDYYKERSTRVAAPSISTVVALPDDWRVNGRFLVDQITSASGAFTATDEPFTENRIEASVGADKRWGDYLPSLSLRISDETDYTSLGVSASVTRFFNDDLTTLTGYLTYNHDEVSRRTSDSSDGARQQGADQFAEQLDTVFLGVSLSQILSPNLRVGGSFKLQVFRGFLENVYRQEQHPLAREDYTLGFFSYYRHPGTGLGFNLDLCLHASAWSHLAWSTGLEMWWTATRWLEVVPMIRGFHQFKESFFANPNGATRMEDGQEVTFNTSDPSLTEHFTVQAGVKFVIRLWPNGLRLMPAYYYRVQDYDLKHERLPGFGNAHIAQLGLYYPF